MRRTLHINNIANMAYGNAKILRQYGFEATVICRDISHLMSQPEWDDLELDPAHFPDETNFYHNTADLSAYRRPDWFHSEKPFVGKVNATRSRLLQFAQRLPASTKARIAPLYHNAVGVRRRLISIWRTHVVRRGDMRNCALEPRIEQLCRAAADLGRDWRIDRHALQDYVPQAQWIAERAQSVDAIFSYYLSSIPAALYCGKPWVSVDIGTMREMPLGSSAAAQLQWLAYRQSDHVLLTNPDTRALAERRGITSFSFCPHPVDEAVFYSGGDASLRAELQNRYRSKYLLLAPARQNWAIKGNDKMIRAFAKLRNAGIEAALIVPAWGQEVDKSKALARDLGVEAHLGWCAPLSEPLLARYFRAVDLVLDQFQLGVFGLITPKAMACGKPVLTSYDAGHNAWCFPEPPPLVQCQSDEEIFKAMRDLLNNVEARREIGDAALRWIRLHHSGKQVVDGLDGAAAIATENYLRSARSGYRGHAS